MKVKKSYEELAQIAQEIKAMKPAEYSKKMQELTDGISSRQEAMAGAKKQKGETAKSEEKAKNKQEAISKEIAQLSAKLPDMLAFGQDANEVHGSIGKLVEDSKRLGQLITGCQKKSAYLEREIFLLDEEIEEGRWLLKFYRLVPLPDRWNKKAAELIPIIEEIHDIVEESGFSSHPLSNGVKAFYPSNWEGLEIIPRLCLIGDNPDRTPLGRVKDLWSYGDFKYQRQVRRQAERKEVE